MTILSGPSDLGRELNLFLVAAIIFALYPGSVQNPLIAREVFEKEKARALQIDDDLRNIDIQFTQAIEFRSHGSNEDSLVFNITVRHGKFERQVLSTSTANGDRFNGGYDAFDKMFLLSEYFNGKGKTLTSCEFRDVDRSNCYGLNFTFSKSSDLSDPLSEVSTTLTANDFTPVTINEQLTDLLLGAEFDNVVKVTYDKDLNMCYPEKIVMHVYAHLYFLKGELTVVTIKNRNLKKI
jgi:hypothetical protein